MATIMDPNPTKCNSSAPHTGTMEIQRQLLTRVGGTTNGGLYVCKEIRGSGGTLSFHGIWQAGDTMCPSQTQETPQGLALVGLLSQVASGINLQRIIHARRIWDPIKDWHAFTGPDPHWNHVHWEVNHIGAAMSASAIAAVFNKVGSTIPAPPRATGTLAQLAEAIQAARRTIVRVGDKGQKVQVLQLLLKAHGFIITVDGDYGPATLAAVRQFQKNVGTTVDGIVGPKTWAALVH